jgi:ribonuclease D
MDKYSETAGRESLHLFVKDNQGLLSASEILSREKVIGVDVESDSMFHYKEKVCLIQISSPETNILIDTLSIKDLKPLSHIFSDPEIRKVFHGADYDIRSLFRDFGIEVNSLFDTQIAARFLGIPQTGLSYCLESKFGISMEKKYQKKDWSRRPLPGEMLQYAVKDTCYLMPLALLFEKELREKKRYSWFEEECELLSKVRPSPPRNEPLFLRFKGASKLDPRKLAILDDMLKWREELAARRDIPPFKILGNLQIMEILEKRPIDIEGLDILSLRQVSQLGKSILKIVQTAMEIPDDKLPVFPKTKKQNLSAMALKKISALREWREGFGGKTGLDPSIICPNSLIQEIVLLNPRTAEELKGLDGIRKWQINLFGEEVCALLNSIPRSN